MATGTVQDRAEHAASDAALRRARRRRLALSLAVAIGGAIASFLFYGLFLTRERQLIKVQFDSDAGHRVNAIQRTVSEGLDVVEAISAFFAGSEEVTRQEFQAFTRPLLAKHSGVQTLAWVPRVVADQREKHEATIRQENISAYRIIERNARGDYMPVVARTHYYPITFVVPARQNGAMLGFDLGSNPACRTAIERAMASGEASALVIPPLEENDTDAFLLYVFEPATTNAAAGGEEPAGPAAFDGVVLGVYRLHALVDAAMSEFLTLGIDVSLSDPATPPGAPMICRWTSPLHGESEEAPSDHLLAERMGLGYVGRVKVADYYWNALCLPMNLYITSRQTWQPRGALLGGLLGTTLLVGYLWLLTGRTVRVERLVAQRTAALRDSEARHRVLFESSHDAMMTLAPPLWRFTACNPATVKMFDVQDEAEFTSLQPWQLSPPTQPDGRPSAEKAQEMIETAMRQGSHFFEWTHHRLNGKNFPATVLLTRMELAGQAVLQATVRDITAQKQAEDALHAEQRLLRELINLQEHDRQLVAYEIHDGLAQQLTAAWMKFQSIEPLRETDPAAARAMFDAALAMLHEGMAETRRLIGGLRPPVLDQSGVVAAVDFLIDEQRQRGGPEIDFAHDVQFNRLAAPLEIAIFRIVQECLTNACRYSRSEKVRVELGQADGRVVVDVRDWGVGFDPTLVQGDHFGLRSVRERARLLGGQAVIKTAPGKGTRVTVELPLLQPPINGDAN